MILHPLVGNPHGQPSNGMSKRRFHVLKNGATLYDNAFNITSGISWDLVALRVTAHQARYNISNNDFCPLSWPRDRLVMYVTSAGLLMTSNHHSFIAWYNIQGKQAGKEDMPMYSHASRASKLWFKISALSRLNPYKLNRGEPFCYFLCRVFRHVINVITNNVSHGLILIHAWISNQSHAH